MTRQQTERQEAIEKLKEWVKPGDTVYTILDNVSRSGMSRAIRVVLMDCKDGRPVDLHPNWLVGKALGLRHWKRNGREQDALVVGGCGMDMGFALVNDLSQVLYGEGYVCTGKDCPSNSHHQCVACEHGHVQTCHNGDDEGRVCDQHTICQSRVFHSVDTRGTGLVHTDGYALRQRWL